MQDFSIGSDWESDPLIEMYVIGTEICPWGRDPSLKWVQYRFGRGIRIWVWVSGNMFCTILCSHKVWNPNLNPSPAVEISHTGRARLIQTRLIRSSTLFEVSVKSFPFITSRNEVVAKVMFLQVSVCPQGGEVVCLSACWDDPHLPPPGPGTGQTPPQGPGRHPPGPGRTHSPPPHQADTHPPDQADPPPEADSSIRSTSGRYASYWNAFLFSYHFMFKMHV